MREFVRQRSGNSCEYCRLPQQADPLFTFHVEHVIARQHGGSDEPDNLALACHHCNCFKGPNLASIDPETGDLIRLFHPRRDDWQEHFAIHGNEIMERTSVGRTTARLLQFNAADRVELRQEWIKEGEIQGNDFAAP